MPPCAAMNAPAMSSSSPVVIPGRDVLSDVGDRRGDEVAGAGDALDLLRSLADDHRARERRLDLGEDVVDAPLGVERASVPAAR